MRTKKLTQVGVAFAMSLLASACTEHIDETTVSESTNVLASDATTSNQVALYRSRDWVSDGVFTQGVEGPAVAKNGVLYAVNFKQEGSIGQVSGENEVSALVQLPNGSVGNGIRFDAAGNMYIADYVNHNVLKITATALNAETVSPAQVQVYAHSGQMNQPNDIAIMAHGTLFASDPDWSNNAGQLWRINTQGQVALLESDMGTTNGVEVSPDNKTLYVNESVQRNVWQYSLSPEGEISDKKLLIKFDDFGLDGMRTDTQGNLYIARYGKGVVAIVSPQGELLREVPLNGKHPTNVAFGGNDGKTVFVTMQKRGAIEAFRSEYVGRSFITD